VFLHINIAQDCERGCDSNAPVLYPYNFIAAASVRASDRVLTFREKEEESDMFHHHFRTERKECVRKPSF
jgi:hypothetical protein